MTDLFFFAHDLNQRIVYLLGIAVQNPNPYKTLYPAQLFQKLRQRFMSVDILPVYRSLLRHQNQFFHTLIRKRLRLLQQTFHRNAPVRSPHLRNNAVSAVFIASLRYLQISKMATGGQNTLFIRKRFFVQTMIAVLRFSNKSSIQNFWKLFDCGSTDHGIHLFDFLPDLLLISLCQTSRHNEHFYLPAFLQFRHLQNGVDTLLLGIPDEAAGIHDCGVRLVFVIRKAVAVLCQHTEHPLGIHQIFITSQRLEQYLFLHRINTRYSPSAASASCAASVPAATALSCAPSASETSVSGSASSSASSANSSVRICILP